MKSKVFITRLIDDPAECAQALADQVARELPLQANSVGILMAYSDMDVQDFAAALRARLPFDIIGLTCIASMDGREGFHELAAQLVVLTGDDCCFGVGLSPTVEPGQVEMCVQSAYDMATGRMDGDPKALYMIPPYNLDIMFDEYTNALNRIAPDVPVLGGLPSNNGNGDLLATIFGKDAYENRLVLLAIGGAVRPVFDVQRVMGSVVERKRKVTLAKDNTVYRVGNQRFTDYMVDIGFPMDKVTGENDTITYVSNPLLLENFKLQDGQDFSFVRTLHKIDLEEGSGTAVGSIPEDATLSICSLDRGDMIVAAETGIRSIREKMKPHQESGYVYSTLLAVSCVGRYLVMLPHGGAEAEKLCAMLPDGLSFSGFYGYGEIGPLPFGQDQSINFAHNESLVLCAL